MTDALIESGTLYADLDARTVSGLLVPYGEEGNTNLGRFTVEAGAFTIPRDASVVTLNADHNREEPLGRAVSLTEEEDGIHGTFHFADTDEATAALMAVHDGSKARLSVEAKGLVIRAGKALKGHIFGAAVVTKGAFPSATLLAADAGELDDQPSALDRITAVSKAIEDAIALANAELEALRIKTTEDSDESEDITETPLEEEETTMADAVVPNTLTASQPVAATPISIREIDNLLYASAQGQIDADTLKARLGNEAGATLFAALSDVKYDGTGGLASTMGIVPQWIGEVWSSVTYRQQVLPLFAHRDLTSLSFNGFKWTTKPSGGTWAGNKGNVPSNTLVVAPVTGTAARYAIGHDIAREFVDLPVPGFFESYAAAVSEDYAKWADLQVATAITAGATTLTADALTTLPGVTGGTIGSAASAIIDGATVLVTNGSLPSFALVAPALWKQMAKMPKSNILGYLNASLGLSEGDLDGFVIRPSASVAAGKVLVGAREAVTVFELPGAPIRIDALDLARGGIDKAAFGYAGVVINDATALQLVTAATA